MKRYRIEIAPRVAKDLTTLPRAIRLRVESAIDALSADPRPPGVKKLVGEDAYRIRISDYRVIYEITDAALVVLVVRVRHRKEVYR